MQFRTTLLQTGKTTTGIVVPPEIVQGLGSSKKPAVSVTINGYTYRSTIASMGGKYMLPVSNENRQAAGVAGGDEIEVTVELDNEVREVVVPADFAEALAADAEAKRFFDSLSYSNKSRHVLSVEGAKTPETRQRRIEKAVSTLHDNKI